MGHSLSCLFFHLVWSTYKRVPYITNELKPRLYRHIGSLIETEDIELVAIGGIYDHIHLLIQCSRPQNLSMFLRRIKSSSSKFMNEINKDVYFAWQKGYGNFSVSPTMVHKVAQYINNQEAHHKNFDYDKELEFFMKLIDATNVPERNT